MNHLQPRIFGVKIPIPEYLFYKKVWEKHYAGLPQEPPLESPIGRLMENFLRNAANIWGNRLGSDREYIVADDHSEGHRDLCGCLPHQNCRICTSPSWRRGTRPPEERENAVLLGVSPSPVSERVTATSQLSLESLQSVCEELRNARPSIRPPITLESMREMLAEILDVKPKQPEIGAKTQHTPRGEFEKTGKTLNADEDLDRLFDEIDAITK